MAREEDGGEGFCIDSVDFLVQMTCPRLSVDLMIEYRVHRFTISWFLFDVWVQSKTLQKIFCCIRYWCCCTGSEFLVEFLCTIVRLMEVMELTWYFRESCEYFLFFLRFSCHQPTQLFPCDSNLTSNLMFHLRIDLLGGICNNYHPICSVVATALDLRYLLRVLHLPEV